MAEKLSTEEWERSVMMAAAIMASGVLSTFASPEVQPQVVSFYEQCYEVIVAKLRREGSTAIVPPPQ